MKNTLMKSSKNRSNKNIHYSSKEIENHFSKNRTSWSQFYPSERKIILKTGINKNSKVLDIGCACGGLGLALREKFDVTDYTGIEINHQAIKTARKLNPQGKFINTDILEARQNDVKAKYYDYVFSLSCIDWNVEFDKMLNKSFSFVKPDGNFIISLRLSFNDTVNDIIKSFQFIDYNNKKVGEVASYVVLNFDEIITTITKTLDVSEVNSYGFWGKPSNTAITPYNQIFFAVFSIKKRISSASNSRITYNLDFPNEVLRLINPKLIYPAKNNISLKK